MSPSEIDVARGERIRAARNARGWTQRQLAEAIGAGVGSPKNWEKGKPISGQHAASLERVLGITLSETVGVPQDAGREPLLDLPDEVTDGFSEMQKEEWRTALRAQAFEIAAKIRSR